MFKHGSYEGQASSRPRLSWTHGLALAAALTSGCMLGAGQEAELADDAFDGDESVGSASEPLIGGTAGHRPELVDFLGGCTGTLIGPNWVLAAAHCWNHQEAINDPLNRDTGFVVRTSTDGVNWGTMGGAVFVVDRIFDFSSDTLLGAPDVVLARLATSVPSTFISTFPTLATAMPATGATVTIWGKGCTNWDTGAGSGTMRFFQGAFGSTQALCRGDSGGPARLGTASSGGAIWGVNSGVGDIFGNVVQVRTQIQNIMATWGTTTSDISFSSTWCPSAAQLYWADPDGDGDLDAICADPAAGVVRFARNTNRRVVASGTVASTHCASSDSEVYVGDFNNDDRSDIACRRPSVQGFQVLFGQTDGTYSGGWIRNDVVYCTHANAQLYTGDFNGDGRTDLLCKDPDRIWIDYAAADGTFDFVTYSDEYLYTVYCTHAGAKLYLGDFNGDRRTDLLCVTRSNGDLQVDFAAASGFPFTNIDSHIYVGESPGIPSDACKAGDKLSIMDADADGRSDLYCVKGTTGSSWGGSVRSSAAGAVPFITFDPAPNGFTERYGWSRSVRPRLLDATRNASQPWQRFLSL
ncbi:FG-GAP-like repeat-containing protein [Pyxidicoccus sp. MSG2]|uniref:FG-GAP-like repeat-containing protein n=1 Tax=Pyxidicoccus sp. MSG2 TaxID=2996790 RepID=UPI00226E23C8|nr:FG-GAP-like repeat-containing protein [Pyxidicoccus sp. MSG2]MCY1021430.1 FG-GAP-like repeat-containing protein [Pyxidicoccus sp. MSG2]